MTEDRRASDLGSQLHAGLPRFLDDQPCRDPDKMRFGHDVYIAAIRDAVASCPTPYTIGLYGKWGTGKTTVLEGLRATLHKQSHLGREFKVCLFDAWKYSQETSFRRQFLAEFDRQLNLGWDLDELLYRPKEEFKLHWGALARNLVTVLGVFALLCAVAFGVYWVASRAGAAALANTFLSAAVASVMTIVLFVVGVIFDFVRISTYRVTHPLIFAPEQFEEQFRRMLRKAKVTDKRRLVVLIDNLDRCSAEATVDALRTIKTFLEHEGCVYVVACDEAALVRHLTRATRGSAGEEAREAERDAKEFLRKFFQSTMDVEPLPGDLRDFASEQVEAAGLQADVATVVWAANPRDPRRIIQFLNRLVLALYVVTAREQSGRLLAGVVSRNHAYLAKLIWLREQWRDFLENCGAYPDLLELADQVIVHPATVDDHPAFATYLGESARRGEYADLHGYLEATLHIKAPDPRPFLALQMSALDMGIADAQAFRDKLRQGQVEQIGGQLAAVTNHAELLVCKEIMTRTIEEELDHSRRLEAIQACRVAVACFDMLPPPRQQLADAVCRTTRGADPQRDIPTFTQPSLLRCMAEASSALSQPATMVVVRSLDPTSPHTAGFFDGLPEHGELLNAEGWSAVGEFILATLSSGPEAALQYLGAIEHDSAVASHLFHAKPNILTQLATRIAGDVDLWEKACETFGRFREHADQAPMNQLALTIVSLISAPPEARVEAYGHRALSALSHLDVAKVSLENINKLHEALHHTMTEPRSHEEIAHFLTHELRIYSRESEGGQQQTLQAVRGFVASWPAEKLSLLGEVIWRAELEPLSITFVDAAAARASDPQRSEEEIEQVLAALAGIPLDTESVALSTALTRMLERPERPVKELGAKSTAAYADRLPPASLQELVRAVHREYMATPGPESGPMAPHLLELIDTRTASGIRNTFADRLKTLMVDANPAVRRAAAQHYNVLRRRAKLSQDTRKTVAQDVADGLHALRQTLAVEDRPLFNLLLEEQDNPKILKGTWTSLGNTIESLLHSDRPAEVRHMAVQLVSQFHMLPDEQRDGIVEQLHTIVDDESLPQEIRDDAASLIGDLDEAAE